MSGDRSPRDNAPQRDPRTSGDTYLTARRQMIKSAIAAVPVVLTVTAGTAQAQGSITSAVASFQAGGLQGGGLEGAAPSQEIDVQRQLEAAMKESEL